MKTESAKCAAAIKQLLKAKFPCIKFSVKSDQFAGGDAVRIDWNLGPVTKDVDAIVGQFQYGHFDGMIDMYESSNSRDDIPQAKYVQTQREYESQEEIDAAKHNRKLKWSDPARIDLWKQEKTLHHIIAKELCEKMGISYDGMYTVVPEDYQHMTARLCKACVSDLVGQLLYKAPLMEGYHGIKNEISEEGREISNSYLIY